MFFLFIFNFGICYETTDKVQIQNHENKNQLSGAFNWNTRLTLIHEQKTLSGCDCDLVNVTLS